MGCLDTNVGDLYLEQTLLYLGDGRSQQLSIQANQIDNVFKLDLSRESGNNFDSFSFPFFQLGSWITEMCFFNLMASGGLYSSIYITIYSPN